MPRTVGGRRPSPHRARPPCRRGSTATWDRAARRRGSRTRNSAPPSGLPRPTPCRRAPRRPRRRSPAPARSRRRRGRGRRRAARTARRPARSSAGTPGPSSATSRAARRPSRPSRDDHRHRRAGGRCRRGCAAPTSWPGRRRPEPSRALGATAASRGRAAPPRRTRRGPPRRARLQAALVGAGEQQQVVHQPPEPLGLAAQGRRPHGSVSSRSVRRSSSRPAPMVASGLRSSWLASATNRRCTAARSPAGRSSRSWSRRAGRPRRAPRAPARDRGSFSLRATRARIASTGRRPPGREVGDDPGDQHQQRRPDSAPPGGRRCRRPRAPSPAAWRRRRRGRDPSPTSRRRNSIASSGRLGIGLLDPVPVGHPRLPHDLGVAGPGGADAIGSIVHSGFEAPRTWMSWSPPPSP